jgi:hypothetical protein
MVEPLPSLLAKLKWAGFYRLIGAYTAFNVAKKIYMPFK